MQLEEIVLNNFRGFRNYTLRLGQFNVLIGKNSSGKTSLLQAIHLIYDAIQFLFGRGTHPSFTGVPLQLSIQDLISRFGLSDKELIFFKKIPEDLRISAKWDNGFQLKFSSHQRTYFKFDLLKNGTLINDKLEEPGIQELITSVYSIKPAMLPPVGTISPNEKFISRPEIETEHAQGRYNETWRNSLFWTYNNGDKTVFGRISEFIQTHLPGSDILPPRLSSDNPPRVIIEYSDGSAIYDVSSSGGGLRTLISLAATLMIARASCILLDEPDAHLHSGLQRQIAEMLLEYTESQNVQMVIATHSPDIIDSVPLHSLLLVDRAQTEAHLVDDVGHALVSLGALTNSQAVAAIGADSIINLEGDADEIVLSGCAEKLGLEFPPGPNCRLTRSGRKQLDELRYIRRGIREFCGIDMKLVQVNDLDYNDIVDQSKGIRAKPDDGILHITLGRKEIENYLLDADAITKVIEAQFQRRNQSYKEISSLNTEVDNIINQSLENHKKNVSYKVKPLIRDRLPSCWNPSRKEQETDKKFENLWEDREWRLCACPGKKVLRNIRRAIQKKWGISVETGLLSQSLDSVPEHIRAILEKLSDFLKA